MNLNTLQFSTRKIGRFSKNRSPDADATFQRASEVAKLLDEHPRSAVQQNNLFCSGTPRPLSYAAQTAHGQQKSCLPSERMRTVVTSPSLRMHILAITMNGIGVIVLFVVFAFAAFVWRRKRDDAQTSEVERNPQTISQQIRNELGLKKVIAQFLVLFGGLLFIGGVVSLLGIDESIHTDRRTAIMMVALSVGLLAGAVVLSPRKRS